MEQMMKRDIDRNDALMTSGLAILTMLVLHLFCRTGDKVYGTPLLWFDKETPFVYWFGFFAEVCVTLYSLRGGYAVYLQGESGKANFKNRALRCLKLMETYWIIDILFSIISIVIGNIKEMPVSIWEFLKSLVLLRSFNGAWWYLTTYIIISLFFAPILYKLAKKTNFFVGMAVGRGGVQIGVYFMGKFDLWPSVATNNFLINWFVDNFVRLWGPLFSFFAGCLLCRFQVVSKIRTYLDEKMKPITQKILLLLVFVCDFIAFNLIHKAILVFFNALLIFVMFNLWEKGKVSRAIFMFLGKHSTAIWLSHMFFYLYVFTGLVQKAKYPVLMLLFMLALTIATSYIVIGVKFLIDKLAQVARGGNKKCLAEKK